MTDLLGDISGHAKRVMVLTVLEKTSNTSPFDGEAKLFVHRNRNEIARMHLNLDASKGGARMHPRKAFSDKGATKTLSPTTSIDGYAKGHNVGKRAAT